MRRSLVRLLICFFDEIVMNNVMGLTTNSREENTTTIHNACGVIIWSDLTASQELHSLLNIVIAHWFGQTQRKGPHRVSEDLVGILYPYLQYSSIIVVSAISSQCIIGCLQSVIRLCDRSKRWLVINAHFIVLHVTVIVPELLELPSNPGQR